MARHGATEKGLWIIRSIIEPLFWSCVRVRVCAKIGVRVDLPRQITKALGRRVVSLPKARPTMATADEWHLKFTLSPSTRNGTGICAKQQTDLLRWCSGFG